MTRRKAVARGGISDRAALGSLRRNAAPRLVVASAAGRGDWFGPVCDLCDAPCIPGAFLRMGALSLALLFSANRSGASLVAVFACHPGFRRPAGISHNLLLLPQSILPCIFSGSGGVRRRRGQTQLRRRNKVSADPAKRPPLLLLSVVCVSDFPVARRGARIHVERA